MITVAILFAKFERLKSHHRFSSKCQDARYFNSERLRVSPYHASRSGIQRVPVIVNCITRHPSSANDTIRWRAVNRYYISDGLIANKDLWISCAPLAECESPKCPAVTRVYCAHLLSFSPFIPDPRASLLYEVTARRCNY